MKHTLDFRYLGLWIADSKKDMEVQIGLAWKELNKLDKIWKSKLKRKLLTVLQIHSRKYFAAWGRKLDPYQ